MKNDEFLKKSSEPNVNPNVIQFLSVRNTTFAYLPYTLMECMVNISKEMLYRRRDGKNRSWEANSSKEKGRNFS